MKLKLKFIVWSSAKPYLLYQTNARKDECRGGRLRSPAGSSPRGRAFRQESARFGVRPGDVAVSVIRRTFDPPAATDIRGRGNRHALRRQEGANGGAWFPPLSERPGFRRAAMRSGPPGEVFQTPRRPSGV